MSIDINVVKQLLVGWIREKEEALRNGEIMPESARVETREMIKRAKTARDALDGKSQPYTGDDRGVMVQAKPNRPTGPNGQNVQKK